MPQTRSCTPGTPAGLLNISDDEATERLERLHADRVLSRVTLTSRLPPAYRITRHGTQQTDPALPPLRALDMGRYRHEIGVTWIWAAARAGRLGQLDQVLSRREMQAADTTHRTETLLDTPAAVFADQAPAGASVHPRDAYPDLALIQTTGWASVELVLQRPGPARLRHMITRQQRQPRIRAALFLVEPDREIGEAIRDAAAQLGLEDKVHLQALVPNGIGGA